MDIRQRQRLIEQAKANPTPAGVGLPDPRQRDVTRTLLNVGVRGYSPTTANYQDVYIDGNDSDGEVPLPTGLLKVDSYLNSYDEGQQKWNRLRGNYNELVFASVARTVTTQTPVMDNFNSRGGHFLINVTALGAGVTLIPTIYAYDPITALTYPLLNDTAAPGLTILAAGTYIQKIYPGITTVAGLAASDILPRFFQFRITHGGAAGSATYSVSFNQVV